MREKCYRAYLEFFESAERKRRWSVFHDVPWEKLDRRQNSEQKAVSVEMICGVELYLPDYGSQGIALFRSVFGLAWFQACWSYEESKHGLALREYLTRSGLRTDAQFAEFERGIFDSVWKLPFDTSRKMFCYGALQEAITYLFYKAQKEAAQREGDKVLETICNYIGRDEAAHAGFYRTLLELELEEDRDGTLADLAYVVSRFKMPADGHIAGYEQRLRELGIELSSEHYFLNALFPTLTSLGINRNELKVFLRRNGSPIDKAALAT
jgi:acyl-[acyl-carrier-protein] desaturase